MNKISVVVTVKDDEEGVRRLLADLEKQTVKPDEIIVVMAGKKEVQEGTKSTRMYKKE